MFHCGPNRRNPRSALGGSPGPNNCLTDYSGSMLDPAALLRHYLLFFILPLWMAAGLTDYVLHKRTHIEENAGTKESILHALQLGEAGVPVLLALLLEVNALIFLVMVVAFVLHELTALWDVSYASAHRYVSPLEQHVHSFMEVLPLMALSFVTIMYWNQFVALIGLGPEPARFELRPKSNPISTEYLAVLFSSIAVFVVLPYGEELWRCLRASRLRHIRHNTKQTLRPSQAA
jgi:hypothetical protein